MASQGEQPFYGLSCEFVDKLERTVAVWGACIVAQIDVVQLGHERAYLAQHGEPSVAGIEHTDGPGSGGEVTCRHHPSVPVLVLVQVARAAQAPLQAVAC